MCCVANQILVWTGPSFHLRIKFEFSHYELLNENATEVFKRPICFVLDETGWKRVAFFIAVSYIFMLLQPDGGATSYMRFGETGVLPQSYPQARRFGFGFKNIMR
jgi:hypothetical protein